MKTKLLILLTMLFACVMQVKGEVVTETHEVIVGDGSFATNWQGFCSCMSSQSIQNLYLPSEIGTSGAITKLAYQSAYNVSNSAPTDRVKVYMAQVDQTTLTTKNKLNTNQMMLVYEGTVSMAGVSAKSWVEVTLDTPFFYGGEKSLVVAVSNNSSAVDNKTMYCSTSKSSRSVASISSSNPDDVDNTSSYLANTRFTIESSKKVSIVGDGKNNTSWQGFTTCLKNVAVQTLYHSSEIGTNGNIAKLAYQSAASVPSDAPEDNVIVYMAEVEQSNLTTTNKLSTSQMTKVFEGVVSAAGTSVGEWVEITLDNPFSYSGNKNLIVAVSNSCNSVLSKMYYATPNSGRVLGVTSSNDPNLVSSTSSNLVNTRFTFESETYTYGTGTANNAWTGLTGSAHTASYNLYLPSEVGSAGVIGSIGYQVSSSVSTTSTDAVKIYMAEVSNSTLTTSNKLAPSDMTLVFSGNVTLGGRKEGDWIDVSLNCPFSYSGKGNLLVAITNTNSSSSSNYCRYTSVSGRTLYTFDSDKLSDATKTGSSLPNAKFTFAIHNCGRCLVNTVCSVCGNEPTTLSGDIMLTDYDAYTRKNGVSVDGTLSMYLGNLKTSLWRPLYIPFRSYYQGSNENRYYVAKVQDFGVAQDTNGDGVVDSRDERFLTAIFLEDGSYIEPNTPYLIWPMDRYLTLRSSDNRLYPATINELDLSTMKESFVIKGSYEKQTLSVDNLKYLESDDNMYFASTTDYSGPFSWVPEYTMKNGGMVRDHVGTFVHRLGLALNDGISFTTTDPFWCDKVSYTRKSEVITTHNWQGVFVPFEVTVKHNAGSEYPKYATFAGVKTNANGEEEFTLDILKEGDVIPAATPFLMCVDEEDTDLVLENSSVLLHYPSSDAITFDTENASYSISGTTVPTDNLGDEWYAISRYDGMFHPASAGAVLPRYRIYMKLQTKNGKSASELRFVFREASDETAIDNVDAVMAPDAIYTLDGRKVQEESLQPGIYVKNGKKISIRK